MSSHRGKFHLSGPRKHGPRRHGDTETFRDLAKVELNEAAQYYGRLPRRFPYGLLYRVKPVRVLPVMNLKRRPAYCVGRV